MPEELDDDLKDLLDQLDEQDEFLPTEDEIAEVQEEPKPEPKPVAVKEKPPKPEDPPKVSTGDEVALRPIDELAEIKDQRRFDGTEHLVSETVAEESTEVIKYLDKMEEVADEVLQACRSDRQEAQDVINMLRSQCDAAHNKSNQPARMYVDGLVKAVEVKANINGNAVKVMEGVAKMIAATKAGINVQQNSLTVSGAELDEILSRQEPGDDLD
jgi:hypothetical protein